MDIFYLNHKNQKIDLMNGNYNIEESSLFSHKWKYDSKELAGYGGKIKKFKKGVQEKSIVIHVDTVGARSCQDAYELLVDCIEVDVLNNIPGKLYINNAYLSCYLIENKPKYFVPYLGSISIEMKIATEYDFWIQELTKQFLPQTAVNATRGLNYPFDYPFNYAPSKVGLATWEIDHYTSSHFLMRIYGPCVDPKVFINKYPYQVFTTLEAGDYLEIDTRNNTVIKYLANGTMQNCYNSRQFTPSIFEKIPPGFLRFSWPGNFGIDITAFIERSEPKWDSK